MRGRRWYGLSLGTGSTSSSSSSLFLPISWVAIKALDSLFQYYLCWNSLLRADLEQSGGTGDCVELEVYALSGSDCTTKLHFSQQFSAAVSLTLFSTLIAASTAGVLSQFCTASGVHIYALIISHMGRDVRSFNRISVGCVGTSIYFRCLAIIVQHFYWHHCVSILLMLIKNVSAYKYVSTVITWIV